MPAAAASSADKTPSSIGVLYADRFLSAATKDGTLTLGVLSVEVMDGKAISANKCRSGSRSADQLMNVS
jgi:hypothetical protein